MRTKVKTGIVTLETVNRAIENVNVVIRTVIQNASKNVTNAQAMKGNTSELVADLETLYALRDDIMEAAEEVEKEKAKAEAAAKRAEAKLVADAERAAANKPKITKPQEDEAKTPSSNDAE